MFGRMTAIEGWRDDVTGVFVTHYRQGEMTSHIYGRNTIAIL